MGNNGVMITDCCICVCGNMELIKGRYHLLPGTFLCGGAAGRGGVAGGPTNVGSCLAHADPLEHLVLVSAEEDSEHSTVDELGLILTWQRWCACGMTT